MATTVRLNPPQLNSKLPAFCGTNLVIPFDLNKAVSIKDFKEIAIIM